jgi:hypothetical protein
VPYSQLATDLTSASTTPNYAFITPNSCSDMHDCSIATGDAWLGQQVPKILTSPAFTTQHSLLALTWDEDDFTGTNHVVTILQGYGVTPRSQSSVTYDHYSLLRTIEAGLGLSTLTVNDAAASPISDLFTPAPPPPTPSPSPSPTPPPPPSPSPTPLPPAVVTSIAPLSGPAAGGTSVAIGGSGFLGAGAVSFGTAAAASFRIVSDGQITAVSPPQAPGTVHITVTTAAISTTSLADQFSVKPVFPGQYTPLAPFRILDTRNRTGGFSTLGPGQSIDVNVAGVAGSGVPAMTDLRPPSAVALNVTVTGPTAPGYLTVYPTGVSRPLASNLNFMPGQTAPNLVQVAVGIGGKVSVYNSNGSSDVIFDVAGWISTGGTMTGTAGLFRPLLPARLLDTRTGLGGSRTLGPGQTINLQVASKGGVPATGANAAILNVTATNPTAPSFLTVFPSGATQPLASNVNFVAGETVPNRVIAKLGTAGSVSFFNGFGSVDVVVDVAGWFTDGTDATATGGQFTGVTPARIFDSRSAGTPVGANGTIAIQVSGQAGVPASGASAVVLNITVTNTTEGSFLTVYPSDASVRPLASDLNWPAGKTVPNLVVVKLGADGKAAIFNSAGRTDVIADVVGWYS